MAQPEQHQNVQPYGDHQKAPRAVVAQMQFPCRIKKPSNVAQAVSLTAFPFSQDNDCSDFSITPKLKNTNPRRRTDGGY